MTDLINQPEHSFIGRVYTTADIDQMGTFAACWDDFEQAGHFAALDAQTTRPNRTYLLVFNPYGAFQYWIGSVLGPEATAPAGLAKLQLPAGGSGVVEEEANAVLSMLPVETTYMKGLDALEKAGFPLPNHIGQTNHPYYLEQYLLADEQVKKVQHILYINLDQLDGYDEFD
ncbi:MAG: hypothetical protein LKJ69_00395 [Lactobacillus sp.]|jgi:hypothetical protein|nr:hypothetical protein [Lactobacillus sp.]MCI2031839.1 hypothetical protein [Lactobacillus sp.]